MEKRMPFPAGQFATAAILLIVGGLLLLRAVILANPLILPDEYGYLALSQVHPHPEVYYAHDPYMLRLNNVGFFALGRLMFALSDAPESLLEAANVLCFLAALLLIRKLMASVAELPGWGALWIAAILFPYSCFTANFMPESLYMLVFWVMAYTIALYVPKRPIIGSLIAGVSCSALFLVKPHAIALLPALVSASSVAAALAGSGERWRRAVAAGLAASASFYLGVVVLFFVLGGSWEWSVLKVVGAVYRLHLVEGASLDARALGLGARVIAGNLVVLVALFGPALVALASRGAILALQAWRGRLMTEREVRMLTILVFTVTAMAGLLAMITKFTVDTTGAQGMPRVYGRHYGFAVPLLLVACVIGSRQLTSLRPGGIRAIGFGGMAGVASVWFMSRSFSIYPWDDPTAFAFSIWEGRVIIPRLALVILVAFYLSMLLPFRRWMPAYAVSLAAVFLLGNLATFGWQKPWSDAMAEKVAAGKALRAVVSPDELDRGMVVGARRYHAFSAVLFGFRAPARVLELPSGAVLDRTRVPAGVPWVAVFDEYDIRLKLRRVVRGPGFLMGRTVVTKEGVYKEIVPTGGR